MISVCAHRMAHLGRRARLLAVLAAPVLVAGCASKGEIVVDEGVGITAVRTTCPAVGIPDYTGNITLFTAPSASPVDGHDARAIDVSASMTDVRSTCDQASAGPSSRNKRRPVPAGGEVHTSVALRIEARRTDTAGARDVTLPWFITVLRGNSSVVSKRVGQVTLHFADGAPTATASATGSATIEKAEATLDRATRERILRKRKAGEADAATDPLADPEVKAAVDRATFEVLVGFALNDQQLAYNATR